MTNSISALERKLSIIFSKEYEYHIPAYQRPYAWTEDEAKELFDDLYDFYRNEEEKNYFLGSIVLVKKNDKPQSEVIDGQQRLTTLTILLAIITNKLSGGTRDTVYKYICEPGNLIEKIPSNPRLYLRDKDCKFFHDNILNLDIRRIKEMDIAKLDTEAKQHIVRNCRVMLDRIETAFGNDESQIVGFTQFLMNNCYLVSVATSDESTAFRIFSVMNDRGLDLLPVDIFKSEVIGKIDEDEREKYTEKWEDMETEVTRAGFNDLFSHIRMIYAKSKAQKTLTEEYKQYVWPNVSQGKDFIDTILAPYAEAYKIIRNNSYVSSTDSNIVRELLTQLGKIDNSDWMPVAIKFLATKGDDAEYTTWFFEQLERLVSYMLIASKDVNARIRRYALILDEIENQEAHNISSPLTQIELTDDEKRELIETLDGNIYNMTSKRRNYVIMRLNSFVSDGAVDVKSNILTIEHVLPQTVAPTSQWNEWWPLEEDRTQWIHRIANLVPLTRRANSAAQNYDFEDKKKKYFKGASGTSSYPLTTQVLNEQEWTKEILNKRQLHLLQTFVDKWHLACPEVSIYLKSINQIYE